MNPASCSQTLLGVMALWILIAMAWSVRWDGHIEKNGIHRIVAVASNNQKVHRPSTLLSPTYEIIDGTEVVWQKPMGGQPSNVIFLAHGCQHSAIDWWPKSDSCQACIGLPEEVRIVRAALKRNYLVVAMSSEDR